VAAVCCRREEGVYCYVSQFEVRPEHRDAFLELVQRHAQECLETEPGTVHFWFFQEDGDPNRFYVFEAYVDRAAFDVHRAGPVLARNGPLVRPMLTGLTGPVGRGFTLDSLPAG
jgi:quinol monooxygenase YgiN